MQHYDQARVRSLNKNNQQLEVYLNFSDQIELPSALVKRHVIIEFNEGSNLMFFSTNRSLYGSQVNVTVSVYEEGNSSVSIGSCTVEIKFDFDASINQPSSNRLLLLAVSKLSIKSNDCGFAIKATGYQFEIPLKKALLYVVVILIAGGIEIYSIYKVSNKMEIYVYWNLICSLVLTTIFL